MLIGQERYFVLHAPRQTGKTSTLLALADRLNHSGEYRCVYVNFEAGQAAREDTERAMRTLLGELGSRASETLDDDFVASAKSGLLEEFGPDGALNEVLVRWAADDPTPLVLLVDEIDSLIGDTLISVLRQLRSGYDRRPSRFPQSAVLCGVRDIRDYRIHSSTDKTVITGGSAFNIKAESLRLGDFSSDDVWALVSQHQSETGQAFAEDALARIWDLTRGQPWLVNALAYRACFRDRAGRDRARMIDRAAIEMAKESLILDRVTHLDQLADKLQEGRVRRVVGPILSGADEAYYTMHDLEYVRDLGLLARDPPVRVANPIYADVVPRELTRALQERLASERVWYVDAEENLDLHGLLEAFQDFFRQHSEHWAKRFGYDEAGPQLMLQAFLQRVVNGGGRIEREYGLGRGRTDLLVLWPDPRGGGPSRMRKHVIECKVMRKGRGMQGTVRDGLEQTTAYMDRSGAETGHLVIFDCREGKSWRERVFRRVESRGDTPVTIWGM